jgi:uncharacterized membrane protein YdjX (TVP38/TMEM64 family)
MDSKRRTQLIRAAVFLLVVVITVGLYLYRNQLKQFESFGYPGIFFLSILANATVIIPLPGVIITSAMGAIFNPFWVAIAAGAGAAIGEMTGYLAGFSGQAVIERVDWHVKLEGWMRKYGDVTVLVLAFIPNPLFDMAGITAGALKMPWYRFLIWCALGKILKMMMFAYGGAGIMYTFMKLFGGQ